MSRMTQFPIVAENLDINTIEDGMVIYQHELDRVHYLNHTAALLIELCTGRNTVASILELVVETFGLKDAEKQIVEEGLIALEKEGIIQYRIEAGC